MPIYAFEIDIESDGIGKKKRSEQLKKLYANVTIRVYTVNRMAATTITLYDIARVISSRVSILALYDAIAATLFTFYNNISDGLLYLASSFVQTCINNEINTMELFEPSPSPPPPPPLYDFPSHNEINQIIYKIDYVISVWKSTFHFGFSIKFQLIYCIFFGYENSQFNRAFKMVERMSKMVNGNWLAIRWPMSMHKSTEHAILVLFISILYWFLLSFPFMKSHNLPSIKTNWLFILLFAVGSIGHQLIIQPLKWIFIWFFGSQRLQLNVSCKLSMCFVGRVSYEMKMAFSYRTECKSQFMRSENEINECQSNRV